MLGKRPSKELADRLRAGKHSAATVAPSVVSMETARLGWVGEGGSLSHLHRHWGGAGSSPWFKNIISEIGTQGEKEVAEVVFAVFSTTSQACGQGCKKSGDRGGLLTAGRSPLRHLTALCFTNEETGSGVQRKPGWEWSI